MRIKPLLFSRIYPFYAGIQLLLCFSCGERLPFLENTPTLLQSGLKVGLWVREIPEGFSLTAAYGSLENLSPRILTIENISSPQALRIEWHRSVLEDNRMQMRSQHFPLVLAPNAKFDFSPLGDHLMITLLSKKRMRNSFEMQLHCNGFPTQSVSLPVRKE